MYSRLVLFGSLLSFTRVQCYCCVLVVESSGWLIFLVRAQVFKFFEFFYFNFYDVLNVSKKEPFGLAFSYVEKSSSTRNLCLDGRIWAHGFIFGWLKFKYLVWIVYKWSKFWILTNPPRILNLKILEFEITSKPIEFFRNSYDMFKYLWIWNQGVSNPSLSNSNPSSSIQTHPSGFSLWNLSL